MVSLEAFGLEVSVLLKEDEGRVLVYSPKSELYSTTEEYVSLQNVGKFFQDIAKAPTRWDFAKISKSINEMCVYLKVCENPLTMNMILTGLNMALLPIEKEMVAFGENRGGLKDIELEYADIADELHRICAEIPYEEIKDEVDYGLARRVVQVFMDIMLTSSTELPYNETLHHNWNYEYGTEV